MKLLIKLILRDAWRHRSRLSLAVTATMAMSCLIVWLIGSLDLMMLQFDQDGENYLGRYHLAMIPERLESSKNQPQQRGSRGERTAVTFPESLMAELRANDLVVQVSPARQIRNVMGKMNDENDHQAALRRQRSIMGIPTQSPAIVGIDAAESPFELAEGRWFANASQNDDAFSELVFEGVMGTGAAASLQDWGNETASPVKVGDTVICRIDNTEHKIKIVGLVEQKLASAPRGSVSPAVGALYVSMQTAEKISPTPQVDYVYVQLREGANLRQFKDAWGKQLQSQNIGMSFLDADDLQQQLNQSRSRGAAGLMGGAASLNSILAFTTIVSILIVLTALSMGVSERSRVFAMLRTVGMSRRHIAVLVFGESGILCLLGWIGGIIAGWCVLQLSVSLQPDVFGPGKTVSLGWSAILTAGVAAMIGSFLAAIIPAWRATRISPLEGMNRGKIANIRANRFVISAMIGLLLLSVSPYLIYGGELGEHAAWRMKCYSLIGLPTQIIGCVLLVPMMILLVEKLFAPAIAKLLRLPRSLLKSQLSSNFWRTFGTTIALCVGLTMYTFFEISGYSMLKPYVYSSRLPDTLVTFLPRGIPLDDVPTVRSTPGIDAERCLTLAIDQSQFSPQQTERFLERGLATMQTSAVMFGLDIDAAFGERADGSRPMLELEFQRGTFESAMQKLQTGERYCLVPDSFAFRTGLDVGDKLELVLPSDVDPNETVVEYEICGIVSIDGWIWMNKISGVRKRGYRSGAMLIAPYEAIQRDYKINEAAFFWFDRTLDPSSEKPVVSDAELEESLQCIADKLVVGVDSRETTNIEHGVTRPMVKINSRDYLNERVGSRSDEVIQAAAKMPMILLAISSFGMMGTIAASVRTRRFELGVLRSLGVTRLGIVRLVLAEAILISLAAIAISLTAGTMAAWCFIGLARYVSVFGGFASPLVIPVYYLMIGFGVTLALCILAAIFPAILAARKEPTTLLRGN